MRVHKRLWTFLTIYRRVDAARIIRRGDPMDFADGPQAEPSFLYAAVFAVAAWLVGDASVTDAELPNIVRFARSPGLDPEYQFLFLRHLKRRPELLARLKGVAAFRELAAQLVDLRLAVSR